MCEPKAVYGSDVEKGSYEIPRYDARKEVRSVEDKRSKSSLLMKLEWPEEKIFDDGKQSNTLTGASHPGCCKQ